MKALTICQPYAHLIAIGEKRVENRSWSTRYRGPIAIHAGKSRAYASPIDDHRYPGMAWGAIVATAVLVACLDADDIDDGDCDTIYPWIRKHPHTEGPWCWVLDRVQRLDAPIPYKGAQGLWDWPNAGPMA